MQHYIARIIMASTQARAQPPVCAVVQRAAVTNGYQL